MNFAVPFSASWSSAACRVTVWFVFQLPAVKVRAAPVFTDRSVSGVPVLARATRTVALAEGRVTSFT